MAAAGFARTMRRVGEYVVWASRDKWMQLSCMIVIAILILGEQWRIAHEVADEVAAGRPAARRPAQGNATGAGAGLGVGELQFRGVQVAAKGEGNDDVQRLTFMLYRLAVRYSWTSVVDVPCARSLGGGWVSGLVRQLEFEVPRFRYYCVVRSPSEYASARAAARNASALHVVYGRAPPPADAALLWHAFGYLAPRDAWALVRGLRVRQVAVPNHPAVERNAGHASKTGRVNVRRAPYRFGEPLRIIHAVHRNGTEPKQLLLYERQALVARGSGRSKARQRQADAEDEVRLSL